MECPRCHHRIVPGILFCPKCEAPLKVIWDELNPMGSPVWEYEDESDNGIDGFDEVSPNNSEKLSLPVNRGLKPRS